MIYPDKNNTLAMLADWQRHHAAVIKMMDGVKVSIGLDANGPMCNTVWRLFDAYTGSLAAEVGDFGCWLEWFYSENEMGARGISVGYDGKLRKIKTLANLFWLIEESRKGAVE